MKLNTQELGAYAMRLQDEMPAVVAEAEKKVKDGNGDLAEMILYGAWHKFLIEVNRPLVEAIS